MKLESATAVSDRLLTLRCDSGSGGFSVSHEMVGDVAPSCRYAVLYDGEEVDTSEARYERSESVTEITGGKRYAISYRAKGENALSEFDVVFEVLGSKEPDEIKLTANSRGEPVQARVEGRLSMGPEPYLCKLPGESTFDVFSVAHGPVNSRTAKALFDRFTNSAVTLAGCGETACLHHAPGAPAGDYMFSYESSDSGAPFSLGVCVDLYGRITTDVVTNRQGNITDYAPIDKTHFPTAPSGWLSWYIHGPEETEDGVLTQAAWLQENLRGYLREGEQYYIVVDLGWHKQFGSYASLGRDPVAVDEDKFPHGMKWLAERLHGMGMKCGLWLIPQVAPHYVFEAHPDWFMTGDTGNFIPYPWLEAIGSYIIDPTNEDAMNEYYRPMWETINSWGCDYYKLDGQNDICPFYRQHAYAFKNPRDRIEAYRDTLRAVREIVGDERCIAGCWGIPLDGIGHLNVCRTGQDTWHPWAQGLESLNVLVTYNHLNNVVWWCDPDVLLIGEAKSVEEARVFATAYALSGQMILLGDDLLALPAERVEMIKRIFPLLDIRPMDMYQHQSWQKPAVWDLKVQKPFAAWDVVATFNWQDEEAEDIRVSFADLGIDGSAEHLVYDYWNGEFLGEFTGGFSAERLEPHACRVFSVHEKAGRPQLISTSRHIAQGAYDLLDCRWNEEEASLTGASLVVGDDPYRLTVYLPPGYSATGVEASAGECTYRASGRTAVIEIRAEKNATVQWTLECA